MPKIDDGYDYELEMQIAELVDAGDLEEGTKAHGIAQQVINRGYESLSPKQRYVYDNEVWPYLSEVIEQHAINARINSAPE